MAQLNTVGSLSSWRAWIEINTPHPHRVIMCPSLSSWRAWIEILLREGRLAGVDGRSPHGERGLKSGFGLILADRVGRSPHGERGLKSHDINHGATKLVSRSPHGERGLKYVGQHHQTTGERSLSSWRAWIEIGCCGNEGKSNQSLSSWRAWIEMSISFFLPNRR